MAIDYKVYKIYGIRRFLEKFDTGVNIEKDRFINPIFLEFAKDTGALDRYVPNNKPWYRGKHEPSLDNAEEISANFKEFKKWVKSKYLLHGNTQH